MLAGLLWWQSWNGTQKLWWSSYCEKWKKLCLFKCFYWIFFSFVKYFWTDIVVSEINMREEEEIWKHLLELCLSTVNIIVKLEDEPRLEPSFKVCYKKSSRESFNFFLWYIQLPNTKCLQITYKISTKACYSFCKGKVHHHMKILLTRSVSERCLKSVRS